MDGSQVQQAPQVDVDEAIRLIKSRMPETYKSIQAKAAQSGREAYAMVRRSIAGQANTFWAVERGMVVGTPFNMPDITVDVAQGMVMFGAAHVVIWAKSPAAMEQAA